MYKTVSLLVLNVCVCVCVCARARTHVCIRMWKLSLRWNKRLWKITEWQGL